MFVRLDVFTTRIYNKLEFGMHARGRSNLVLYKVARRGSRIS